MYEKENYMLPTKLVAYFVLVISSCTLGREFMFSQTTNLDNWSQWEGFPQRGTPCEKDRLIFAPAGYELASYLGSNFSFAALVFSDNSELILNPSQLQVIALETEGLGVQESCSAGRGKQHFFSL